MAFLLPSKFRAFISTMFLLLLCFLFTTHLRSPSHSFHLKYLKATTRDGCVGQQMLEGHNAKCLYLKDHGPCISQGYLDYLHIFYCVCERHSPLGYALLAIWLMVLFYLLGNTISIYFCTSVESLSRELKLSPIIVGITLLSLGNGWPDVFSSIVSFRLDSGEVGISGVLGGAFFVSCVVVGIINVCGSSSRSSWSSAHIDRSCFVRDICFLVIVLSSLLAILLVGRINILGAVGFASLYFIYIFIVSVMHFFRKIKYVEDDLVTPILNQEELDVTISNAKLDATTPQIISNQATQDGQQTIYYRIKDTTSYYIGWLLFLIDMPLYLPRRLTIPDVCEERWCRPFAVTSAALAPVLIAIVWNSKWARTGTKEGPTIYLYGGLIGLMLGLIAVYTTKKANPPRSLLPWLVGGFLMSMLWTYITVEELVGLLVSLGYILGISPSILGLTVLAWGNSIGDLIANAAMAMNGGQDGAQIAISGCYAGPIFNTLAGLGLSLVISAWATHPNPFVIPVGPAVFQILGFMIGSLLWTLVILPRKDMRLNKVLGIGLLVIYLCFLSLILSKSLGFV